MAQGKNIEKEGQRPKLDYDTSHVVRRETSQLVEDMEKDQVNTESIGRGDYFGDQLSAKYD